MGPTPQTSVPLRTVRDLECAGYQIHGCCEDRHCRRIWRLSLRRLIAGLGADFPYAHVRTRLACPACGGEECSAFINYGWAEPRAGANPGGR